MASSQNEQDNRNYAVAAGVPMLEPSDSQEAYDLTLQAFELSARFRLPVILRMTTRVCHGKSIVQRRAPVQAKAPAFERDIVGRDEDERAGDAGVGRGEERVRRDVHPDVLHRDEGPRAAERRPEADLQRHLLVRRPLGAAAEAGEGLEDLGGGRAGVAGAEVHPGVERRGRDRFVA